MRRTNQKSEDSNSFKQDDDDSLISRIRYAFRERELLLRADGQVRYIKVRPWMQATALSTAIAIGGWGIGGAVLASWQQVNLRHQKEEILEAKLAYETLRNDLQNYRLEVDALAGRLLAPSDSDAGVSTETLAQMSRKVEAGFNRIAIDLDIDEEERSRIVASRDALYDKIDDLEQTIHQKNKYSKELTDRIARLINQRDEARIAFEKTSQNVASLTRSLGEVKKSLTLAERRESFLKNRIESLSLALNQAGSEVTILAGERDKLSEKLANVESVLDESQDRRRSLEERIGYVVNDLKAISSLSGSDVSGRGLLAQLEKHSRSIVGELHKSREQAQAAENTLSDVVLSLTQLAKQSGVMRDVALGRAKTPADITKQLAHNDEGSSPKFQEMDDLLDRQDLISDPVRQAETLVSEIEGLHDSQRTLVERLSQETIVNLRNTEAVLKLAGLDITEMLTRVGFEGGQGGPFVVAALGSGEALGEQESLDKDSPMEGAIQDNSFADDVMVLEAQVNRWRALQRVVRCVPLISPVDNYHITSRFGKRKDPFNGRWAQHEGIDLGGWPGVPVMAAAPGTVIEARRHAGYGNKVVVDHGCGIRSVYGHLKTLSVKKGQKVDHRHVVGKLGSTGRSTGPHVHYEIQVDGKPLDPEKFIEAGRYVFKI